MKLAEIAEIIIENVEKLLPHLEKQIEQYVLARKEAGLPSYGRRENIQFTNKWSKKAAEWAIRADPRFLKDKKKKKTLDRSKAPFAKHIIKWWLDPATGGGIELPEDIETTAEYLQKFNKAKQQGLNIDPAQIPSWDDMITLLEPYMQENDEPLDKYTQMGLDTVFEDGPWKMYLVDKWIPGEESTLYPGQMTHKAFEGTGVCVKYKSTFEKSYSPPYYLILYKRKRFALIHFPSLQFKNMDDIPLNTKDSETAQIFLDKLFADDKSWLAEIILNSIGRQYKPYGNFTGLLDNYTDQAAEILVAPETIEKIKKDPKLFNKWVMSFDKNIESLTHCMQLGLEVYGPQSNLRLFVDYLRIIDPEDRIKKALANRNYAPEYKQLLNQTIDNGFDLTQNQSNQSFFNMFIKQICEIMPSRTEEFLTFGERWYNKILKPETIPDSRLISAAISFGRIEMNMDHKPTFLDDIILQTQSPRHAFIWAKISKPQGWPEAEQLIVQDEKMAYKYQKEFGKKLTGKILIPITPQDALRMCMIQNREIPEFEDLILTDFNVAIKYATDLIGPWPELEDLLKEKGTTEQKQSYIKLVMYGEEF